MLIKQLQLGALFCNQKKIKKTQQLQVKFLSAMENI